MEKIVTSFNRDVKIEKKYISEKLVETTIYKSNGYIDNKTIYINDETKIYKTFIHGKVNEVKHYKNDLLHNEISPAVIQYFFSSDKISGAMWFHHGEFYRIDNLPTEEQYYENGNIRLEIWHKNDRSIIQQIQYDTIYPISKYNIIY